MAFLLCQTCEATMPVDVVPDGDAAKGHPTSRLKYWQEYLMVTTGSVGKLLFMSPILWLIIAVWLAYLPEYRKLSVYLVIIAALASVLTEFIPLSPVPWNNFNSVTSTLPKYVTAALVAFVAVAFFSTYALCAKIAEEMGNAVFVPGALQDHWTSYWDRVSTWVVGGLVVAGVAFVASLNTHDGAVRHMDFNGPLRTD